VRGVLGVLTASLVSCAGGGGEGHDVVPQSHDVQVRGTDGTNPSAQGYDYVAKRPLAVVALAEARGLDPVVARAAVDRLADSLDTCATDQGRQGRLVDGAARVAVQIDDSGNIAGASVKYDPVKMLTFPPTDAGARGFAVEAIWGRVIPGR
jgi:hypothetical protein